jgi:hypothetical protein
VNLGLEHDVPYLLLFDGRELIVANHKPDLFTVLLD